MNRNVVTEADASRARRAAAQRNRPSTNIVAEAATERYAGEGEPMGGSGAGIDVQPDKWFERLAKYIPAEALGLYLTLAGLVTKDDVEKWGVVILSSVLIVSLVFNTLFLRLLWKVRRWSQIAVSGVALLVYVFATGGLIIQQLWFYEPRVGTALLVATTAFLCFFTPPQAPGEPDPIAANSLGRE